MLVLLSLGADAAPQQPAADGSETQGFVVFLRGAAIGREDVTTQISPAGIVISGRGRLAPPLDIVTSRAEVRYRPDWTPESLSIQGTVGGKKISLTTTFANGEARSEGVEGDRTNAQVDTVSPQTVVIPILFFGAYEALSRRILSASPGTELPAYLAPHAEFPVRVRSIVPERVQTGTRTFAIRRYTLALDTPEGDLLFQLSSDAEGRLVRVTLPSQRLDVVREDVAASTSRTVAYLNPGDEPLTVPAAGFNIAATVTRPKDVAGKLPAVAIASGSGVGDRDGVVAGVPLMGQLAGALADAGFLVVRYDKRGFGQTGGRAESATMSDLADDARAVIRAIEKRNDVDSRRVAILGYDDNAWIALLAASRENRVDAVVAIAAPASTGAELVLERQRLMLDRMKMSDAERQAKIEEQERIHAAVLTGKGWETVEQYRKQADTPWFQSYLKFAPAQVLDDVDQPLLIVHGELDRELPLDHATRLAELARTIGDSKTVELVTIRGVNHLFLPATTGDVTEYPSVTDRTMTSDVTTTVSGWLTKTLAGRR